MSIFAADVASLTIRADSREIKSATGDLDRLARSGGTAERATSRMSAGFASMKSVLMAIQPIIAAIGVSLSFVTMIREQEQYQRNLLRTEALLRATGHAAGFSAKELREQARTFALATLQSVESVERAQQILLSYKNIQGDVFERAIESAADLASLIGGPLNTSLEMLAKVLDDPVQGINAMRRQGIYFSESQQEVIKSLVETNRLAEAQGIILDELAGQFGGLARAEAQGFSGAVDTLRQRIQEFNIAMADTFEMSEQVGRIVLWLADRFLQLTEELIETESFLIAITQVDLGMLRVPVQTLAVLFESFRFVIEGIAIELGGLSAQAAAFLSGNFSEAASIGKMMKEDADARRAASDELVSALMGDVDALARRKAAVVADKEEMMEAVVVVSEVEGTTKELTDAQKRQLAVYQALLNSIREKTRMQHLEATGVGKLTSAQSDAYDIMMDIRDGALQLTDTQKAVIAVRLEELLLLEQQNIKTKEAAELQKEYSLNVATSIGPIESRAQALRTEVAQYGMSEGQINKVTAARMREALEIAKANGLMPEHIAYLEREIKAREQIAEAAGELEILRSHETTMQDIQRSLTDALMRGFEAGNDFAKNFVDTLKNLFQTLVLRPIIEPIAAAGAGMVSSVIGGGQGSIGIPGIPGLGGVGIAGMVSNIASMAAGTALGSFGAGMASGLASWTTAGASVMGTASAGIAAGGSVGAGMALGAAMPIIGGALALGSLLGIGGQNTPTNYWQHTTRDLQTGGVLSQTNNPSSRRHSPENLAASDALSQIAVDAVQMIHAVTGQWVAEKINFGVGNRDKQLAIDGQKIGGTFAGSSDDVLNLAMIELIERSTELSDSFKTLVLAVGTGEGKAGMIGALGTLQQMMGRDITGESAAEFERAQRSATQVYDEQTSAVRDLIRAYDGSLDATNELVTAYTVQQQMAYELAIQLHAASGQIDGLFGRLAENIRQSLMGEEDLYEHRRAQVDALVLAMSGMTDPAQLMQTAEAIERITSQMWGGLDESQRRELGGGFLEFLEDVNALAQDRISAALAGIEEDQIGISDKTQEAMDRAATLQADAAQMQVQAAREMTSAVAAFKAAAGDMGSRDAFTDARIGGQVTYA